MSAKRFILFMNIQIYVDFPPIVFVFLKQYFLYINTLLKSYCLLETYLYPIRTASKCDIKDLGPESRSQESRSDTT